MGNKDELDKITKGSERARVSAANGVQTFIDQTRILLDAHEMEWESRKTRREDALKQHGDNMKESLDAENSYLRARGFAAGGTKNGVVEYEKAKSPEKARNQAVQDYYVTRLGNDDPMKNLGRSIYLGLSKEAYVVPDDMGMFDPLDPKAFSLLTAPGDIIATAQDKSTIRELNPKTTAPEPRSAQVDLNRVMAQMVAFNLIARERAENKGAKVGEIEKLYREKPSQFIKGLEESETLRKVSQRIGGGDLRNFVDSAMGKHIRVIREDGSVSKEALGINQMTQQVMKEYQSKAMEGAQPAQMQNQQQGVEAAQLNGLG